MDNWKYWIFDKDNRPYTISGLVILFILPFTLLLIHRQTSFNSHAAAPDALETEGGVIGSPATIKIDSNASGGSYVALGANQTPTPNASAFPPDTTLSYHALPSFPLPAYLAPFTDPVFGTHITRVTNIPGVRHNYAKTQAWSVDGKYIMMQSSVGHPYQLLDGNNYTVVDPDAGSPGYGQWSNNPTTPNRMYGTYSNRNQFLYHTYISPGNWPETIMHTFANYTEVSLGDGEGSLDDQDNYVALLAKTATNQQDIVVYNLTNDTILATKTFNERPDDVTMSKSGNYVVYGKAFGTNSGVWVYNRDLTNGRLITTQSEHYCVGLDANNNDVLVIDYNDTIMLYRLDTLAGTQLLDASTGLGQGHVSCNTNRRGWVYASSYISTGTMPGLQQVAAVKMDGSKTVEVFGMIHNFWTGQGSTNDQYVSEPQSTVSRDGTKVLTGMEWTDGGPVYDYLMTK